MNYYPHHIGDYAKDASHLTMLEDGAYRRMIDTYYSTEKPLPKAKDALYRLLRAQGAKERQAVDSVLIEFFQEGGDGWHHKRCDEEIERAHEKSAKAAASAGERWHSERNAKAKRTHNGRNAKAMLPITNSQEPITNNQINTKTLASGEPSAGVLIPLADKREWPVPQPFLAELESAYPAVDGPATLREIRAWCLSNPARCKTEGGVTRFINSWFAKVQNA